MAAATYRQGDAPLIRVDRLPDDVRRPGPGSDRRVLCVPPVTRTGVEAVAWTYGIDGREYMPMVAP